MRRRTFITLLGGAAAWPLAARAQQPAMPVIGFLSFVSRDPDDFRMSPLRQGLREAGYVEGQNVIIEYRWAEGHIDRLPALAAELVQRQVAVIVASAYPSALAAKAATATIPIVFATSVDPVEAGLVASLNRPGSNLTGVTNLNTEIGPKRLELLHELLPAATVFALLIDPNVGPIAANAFSRNLQPLAGTLGLTLHVLHASTERDLDAVFATLVQLRAAALIISPSSFFTTHSEQLAALTVRSAVPAIFQFRPFAAAGGLMSYGSDETEYYRLVGIYVLAVLRLMISSTFVDCCTGNSAGFSPLRMRPAYAPAARSRRRGDRMIRLLWPMLGERSEADTFRCLAWLYDGFTLPPAQDQH